MLVTRQLMGLIDFHSLVTNITCLGFTTIPAHALKFV